MKIKNKFDKGCGRNIYTERKGSGKKGRATDQAICPKCNNCVSEK